MWDKIRPKRLPCKCFIESASRTPTKSLGKNTSSFLQVKQRTLHSSTDTCATSPLAAQAQGQLWLAQLHSLGSGCWENSPVGKHHVGSLTGSASTLLESCFPSQLVPVLSAWATLPHTGANPDPNPDPNHSLNILTRHLSARRWPDWELTPATVTRPALLFGLGVPQGCSPAPAATHSSCCIPGAQIPLAPSPKAKGSQATQATGTHESFFILSHTKMPSGFHEKTISHLEIQKYIVQWTTVKRAEHVRQGLVHYP